MPLQRRNLPGTKCTLELHCQKRELDGGTLRTRRLDSKHYTEELISYVVGKGVTTV